MAQEPEEMIEITQSCQATVLNTGTPSDEKFLACRLAGEAAAAVGHPVILDPVGVGASSYRLRQVTQLLQQVRPAVIRGNLGEIQALLRCSSVESGVDCVSNSSLEQRKDCAQRLAQTQNCVVFLSGTTDVVTDGEQTILITGGSPRMSQITGAGCMLSVLIGGFTAVAETPLEGAVQAGAFWKACAGYAAQRSRGAGSFHTELFNGASLLTEEEIFQLSETVRNS
jgi:hydroxyethylthiazole kinase